MGGDSTEMNIHVKTGCCAVLTGQESTKVRLTLKNKRVCFHAKKKLLNSGKIKLRTRSKFNFLYTILLSKFTPNDIEIQQTITVNNEKLYKSKHKIYDTSRTNLFTKHHMTMVAGRRPKQCYNKKRQQFNPLCIFKFYLYKCLCFSIICEARKTLLKS